MYVGRVHAVRTDWLHIQCRICNGWWGVVNADTEASRKDYAIFMICPSCIDLIFPHLEEAA